MLFKCQPMLPLGIFSNSLFCQPRSHLQVIAHSSLFGAPQVHQPTESPHSPLPLTLLCPCFSCSWLCRQAPQGSFCFQFLLPSSTCPVYHCQINKYPNFHIICKILSLRVKILLNLGPSQFSRNERRILINCGFTLPKILTDVEKEYCPGRTMAWCPAFR